MAERTIDPLVPLMVSVNVPRGLVRPTVTVIVDEPGAMTDAGAKDAVAPPGSPVTASETEPEKPP